MKVIAIGLLIIFFLFLAKPLEASSYVLPYPSSMPGSVLYDFNLLKESILKFWFFGSLGQFKYNLKQSDKYLVEAKTLFEYNQALLALHALNTSDEYFGQVSVHLDKAKKEGKNVMGSREILGRASKKHIEVLNKLKDELPQTLDWNPEKDKPQTLMLRRDLNNSIELRKKYL